MAGCAGTSETAEPLLLPMEYGPVDPSDAYARQSVQDFLKQAGAPAYSAYDLSRYDLNGDGLREALVLFKAPYGYWCSMHGCTMLILQARNNGFSLVSDVQPVRAPLAVSDARTNGWKDLIVHVSGRWDDKRDVALQYDGTRYPRDPADLPAYLRYASNTQSRIFSR